MWIILLLKFVREVDANVKNNAALLPIANSKNCEKPGTPPSVSGMFLPPSLKKLIIEINRTEMPKAIDLLMDFVISRPLSLP